MEEIGQEQLLVLLLMRQAERDEGRRLRIHAPGQDLAYPDVHVAAVGHHFRSARPRDQSPRRPRLTLAQRFVIRVEQVLERQVVGREASRQQDEGLEEPGRMSKVPLGGTGVGHGLGEHVLRGQGLGQAAGGRPHVLEAREQG